MKPFPYDKFYPIFMKELKSVFFHFIEQNKGKKPYIFVLKAPDYIAVNHPKSYCLGANGNTVVDFESTGRESAAELKSDLRNMIAEMEADSDFQTDNELQDIVANLRKKINSDSLEYDYKYNSEEWVNDIFKDNDFPKSNAIILDYYIKNEEDVLCKGENTVSDSPDKYYEYSIEFIEFRIDFFIFLIKCLKQLRDEKYFESVYPEKILINFEVREFYSKEDMMRIFEELNTKEEAKLFARFLYG